jgi:hypothetical protein
MKNHILSPTTTCIIICIYCILLLLCNCCCTTITIVDVTAVLASAARISTDHWRGGKSSLFRIYQFRGGASKIEDNNNNNNNNNNSKSKSNNSSSNNINNRDNNRSQISSSLRQFWNIGKKSWTFAVERVSPSWRLPSWRPLAFRSDSNDNDNISINGSGVATSTTTDIATAAATATTKEQQDDDDIDDDNTAKIMTSTLSLKSSRPSYYSPFRMYLSCMGIVSLWILTGTLFYSYYNEWPIPQSFFYGT